jgi:hypothetical protein
VLDRETPVAGDPGVTPIEADGPVWCSAVLVDERARHRRAALSGARVACGARDDRALDPKRARAGERFAVTRARVVRDAPEQELDERAAVEVVALKALVEGVEDRRRLLLCGRATASRLRRGERPQQRSRGIA